MKTRVAELAEGLRGNHWRKAVRVLYRMGDPEADQVLEAAAEDRTLPPQVRGAAWIQLHGARDGQDATLARLAREGRKFNDA